MKNQHLPPQSVIDAVISEVIVPQLERIRRETGMAIRSACSVWVNDQCIPQQPVDIVPHGDAVVGEIRLSFRQTLVPGRSLFHAQVRLPHVAPEAGYAGFDVAGDAKVVSGNVAVSRVVCTSLYGPQPFQRLTR